MSVQYRLMRPEDEQAVVALWSMVFDVPYEQEDARLKSDPHRYETTSIAVTDDGAVLCAAHYRIYERRNGQGIPQRVGEFDPLATAPDSRRAGHATSLLQLVLAAMERAGCDWSLLLTSDMARPLYTRFGWQSFPMRYRRGALSQERRPIPLTRQVCPLSLPTTSVTFKPLHDLYARFTNSRPLTVVRDLAYWERFMAVRLHQRITHEQMHILAAYASSSPEEMRGYCCAHFFPFGFLVVELGADPDDEETIAALLAAVGDEAESRNIPYGEVDLPSEPAVDAAVADLFGTTLHLSDANTRLLARPINPALTVDDLAAIFAAPGTWYAPIDHF